MKKFFSEFKEFIAKGNAMTMAIGIIIGSAFTAIVTALTTNVLNPFLNMFIGGISFDSMKVQATWMPWFKPEYLLDEAGKQILDEAGKPIITNAPTFDFGAIISAIITFLITALCLFLIVRALNRMGNANAKVKNKFKKGEQPAPEKPTTKVCPYCLSEVPYEATRCPHCTSMLEIPKEEENEEVNVDDI